MYNARLYQAGGSKWVSLRTKTKSVAKVKLAKLLSKRHETRRAGTDVEAGSATVGQLAKVYQEQQELRTELNKGCEESLAAACEKAGIERLTHHSLRHLFTTRVLESGVPVPTVARWLAHRDGGASLLKTYSHLLEKHSQEMAGKVQF